MYKKTKFSNGLRLITIPQKSTKAITVFVLFAVGSRYETKDINGVSHFIEHLMFKGTKKRPTTLDISKALDSVGAEYNAATAKDWTGYYVKIDSKKVELALDVLSDMLYNSKFEAKEINKERGVIIEEINMYQDNPLMYIEDVLEQLMYKGSTLGWEIAGPKKIIRQIPKSKILNYKNKFYAPQNTVIAVAGNINSKIDGLIKKFFQTEKQNNQPKIKFKKFKFSQQQPRVLIKYKNTAQVQLAFGFPGYSYDDPKVYAAYLLTIALGGNMSSRLFISVREKRGLAYFVRCYPNIYQDTGNLIIQSGLDKARIDQAIKVILSELKKVKNQGLSATELKKAKEYLRGKVVLTLENTSNLADWYAKQELLEEKILTPEQKLKKFDQVTLQDIKQVANEAFQYNSINLALIGPYKDDKKFLKMLSL